MRTSTGRDGTAQTVAVVAWAFTAGMASVIALVILALSGGETVATAAVAAIGATVTALIGLANAYLRRSGR